jgi:hypothetical protein
MVHVAIPPTRVEREPVRLAWLVALNDEAVGVGVAVVEVLAE